MQGWKTTGGLMAVAGLLLMAGYECIRSASSSLFLEGYSADLLPFVLAGIPFVLLPALYVYNVLLTRYGPRETLIRTSVGSAILILGCVLAIRLGLKPARALLYLVSEVYIMVLVEQYWSFVNSAFNRAFNARFNGLFVGIGTVGSLSGGLLVANFSKAIGTLWMPVVTAVLLLPALILTNLAYRRSGDSVGPEESKETPTEHTYGLKAFREIPLLRALLLLVLCTQVIATVLGFSFQTFLQKDIPDLDTRTAFSGRFYSTLSATALVLQFAVTPVLLRFLGVRAIQTLIPLIHIGGALALLAKPSLRTAAFGLLTFKAIDYSLFRVTKEILYVPFSFDVRYRTKEIIDIFGYRFSKAATSTVIGLVKGLGGLSVSVYSWVVLVAAAVWLVTLGPLVKGIKQDPAVT